MGCGALIGKEIHDYIENGEPMHKYRCEHCGIEVLVEGEDARVHCVQCKAKLEYCPRMMKVLEE